MKIESCAAIKTSSAEVLGAALRRRLWYRVFARRQDALGSFFLDPRDHLGSERLIFGREYEYPALSVVGRLVSLLALGGGVALDVGANIGNHSCWLCARFAHVDCIEPGRVAGLVLEANLLASGRSNWRVYHCALGARQSKGALEMVDGRNLGSSRVREGPLGNFDILRGDDLWMSNHTPRERLELVKIDVEGQESEVIDGMSSVLAAHRPVVCVEVLDQTRWAKLRAQIGALGYAGLWAVGRTEKSKPAVLRWASLLIGRHYSLLPTADTLPIGGHDMAVCLSRQHLSLLKELQVV
jgi:FkbM family methyltransferase